MLNLEIAETLIISFEDQRIVYDFHLKLVWFHESEVYSENFNQLEKQTESVVV